MCPARIAPTLSESPIDGAPAQDIAHHAPPPFDPRMIAGLANTFFQTSPGLTPPPSLPFGPPVAPPNLPDAPAPSIVTTAAPYIPARAPLGPPDVPQTTIPSVAPTPNIPAPTAPSTLRSSTLPFGLTDAPRPGASVGSASPSAAPFEIDFDAIPRLLAGDLRLIPLDHANAPSLGAGADVVPGGSAPPQADNPYFLSDRAPAGAPGAPAALSAPIDPRQGASENFAISGPSEADPHRFSDSASLATPPEPAPMPSDYESNAAPGAAGPAASDALYFLGHSGGMRASPRPRPRKRRTNRKATSRDFLPTRRRRVSRLIPIT